MINRFALSFLCIELDRNEIYEVMLVYILLTKKAIVYEHLDRDQYTTCMFDTYVCICMHAPKYVQQRHNSIIVTLAMYLILTIINRCICQYWLHPLYFHSGIVAEIRITIRTFPHYGFAADAAKIQRSVFGEV